MTIFQTGKNTFAIGATGKLAKYVVRASGKKVTGIRGRRPLLDKRFPIAKSVSAAVKTALREAIA